MGNFLPCAFLMRKSEFLAPLLEPWLVRRRNKPKQRKS